ncbi:hypothetical protein NM208_g8625 [Fusarium decemcellulare]|uniref:Uncharacterized protein n=1 Tax=Fusarium decemcellulare TaxID=57161 RepID=A0ACC1S4K8_9HYPO|nr:hypothetical protein NM208_g8625 [Fusarium decemcellulare]
MSRFSRYDTDEERLPEGMERVGYDADSQVYTFRDADGSYWESAPGNHRGSSSEELEPIPDCPEGTTAYAVHQGDTCWDIAKKNGLSVDDLVKQNAGLDCDALKVNDRICLPAKDEEGGA